jgi:hypothetical protein
VSLGRTEEESLQLQGMDCELWGLEELEGESSRLQGMDSDDWFRAWVANCSAWKNLKESCLETRRCGDLEGESSRDKKTQELKMTHEESPLSPDKNLGW